MDARTPSTTDHPLVGRAQPSDEMLALLQDWAPRQRWFPAKGSGTTVHPVAVIDLVDPSAEAQVLVHLFRLPQGGTLQVPVVVRDDDGLDRPGVIGTLPGGRHGASRLVVDGPHDAAFLRAWFAAAEPADPPEPIAGADLTGARVLTGEQSNTSVLVPATPTPAILKVFRGLSAGPNPDVEVPLALSRVGWPGVPRPLAWLTGSWPGADPSRDDVGHLGVLSELVPDAEDGFELACRCARDGVDFGALAHDLGRTTAQMHRALRTALPVRSDERGPRSPTARAAATHAVVATLRSRAAAAVEAAPVLLGRVPAIDRAFTAVERVEGLPPLQRVHGDYHLGQVLRSEARGWSVLDFEGEPQAAAAEKIRPDLALRDLAGMLRSIDYAAAVGHASSSQWAATARTQLVTGYHQEADQGPAIDQDAAEDLLLAALELDKALYEVVYEFRNRPDWVAIPLDAVDRLLGLLP
ncbi:hypothetical protein [Cellulomonas sp. KRMCY2]|uniref:maltokinase N-terminal cap-like domain-containing protein n=1 Tax=Cellulomonas sp. KRMCY2 TaxID=1304865 RepID=UPI00045E628F|nr:hypothetical protein [Cellulomonas sp. KRMCY2]